MNLEKTEIATKYAQAFLNLYGNSISLETITKLRSLITFLKNHKDYFLLFDTPLFSESLKKTSLRYVMEKYGLAHLFDHLIDLLIQQARSSFLSVIIEQLIHVYKVRNNIAEFVIKSSYTLTQDQYQELINFIQQQVKKQLITSAMVDKQLIAGIRLESDTLLWEYSIAKQLNSIKKAFNLEDAYGH